jgi:hypothetical protein
MMTMPNESDYVPLLDVLREVKQRRSVDDRRGQDIIRDAHRVGDLDLKIRRPNGSFEDLSRRDDVWGDDPWFGETWRQLFEHGIINAEYRVRWSHRRVRSSEPCRIYGVRENLDRFLGVERPRAGAKEQYDWPDAGMFMRKLLDERGDPLDPVKAYDSWRADRDVGIAVQAYMLKREGKEPDISTVMKRIRPELKTWRAEKV